MSKKIDKNQPVTYLELEKLVGQQTRVILNALDEKTSVFDKKFDLIDKRFELMEKRMEKMEERINRKIDRLTTTLDRFLKRMTDMEDEFKIMKADIRRLKKIVGEKLGVEIL